MEGPPGRPTRVHMPSATSTVAMISRIQAMGSRTRRALSQSIFVPRSPLSSPRCIRQYVSNQIVCAIINLRHLSGHQRVPELPSGAQRAVRDLLRHHAYVQAVPEDFEPAVAQRAQRLMAALADSDLGVVEVAGPGGLGEAAETPTR